LKQGNDTKFGERVVLLAVLVMGFSSITIQIVLVREMLIVFSGNELTIGVILANWLLLGALGSYLSGRAADRIGPAWAVFCTLQAIACPAFVVVIYEVRLGRVLLGLPYGEMIGLPSALLLSLMILAPVALIGGASFTFGYRMHRSIVGCKAQSAAIVFAFEAVGAAVGGLVANFVLIPALNSFRIALLLADLNLAVVCLIIIKLSRRRFLVFGPWSPRARRFVSENRVRLLAAAVLLLTLSLSFSPVVDRLHVESVRAEWGDQDVRFYENSVYGNVAVTQGQGESTFFIDGLPFLTSPVPDVAFVEELAHMAMLSHPNPERVLIVGGGAGGLLHEVLKHDAKSVDYVELDPLVVEAVKESPTSLTKSELNDPRVTIRNVDGRYFVSESHELYNVIVVNLPPPSTLLLNRFYTAEFFVLARKILTGDGILAIVAPGSTAYMGKELAYLNACIYRTLREAFAGVRPIPGDFDIFLASPSPKIVDISADVLIQRLNRRSIDSKVLSPEYIRYKLDKDRLSWFMRSIDQANDAEVNKDLLPSAVFYDLWLWNAQFSPYVGEGLRVAQGLSSWVLLAVLGAFFCLFWLVRARTGRRSAGAATIAVVTTGFCGMACTMILLLALQSFLGYVYSLVGLFTATFMTGLSIASLTASSLRGQFQKATRWLRQVEFLGVCLCVCMPAVLLVLHAQLDLPNMSPLVLLVIFVLGFLAGALVGVEFSLANAAYSRDTSRVGENASVLYASDLLGAWLGAALVGILFLPTLGVVYTCLFAAALKIMSFVLVLTSSHGRHNNGF